MEYQRPLLHKLFERLNEPRKFIQVITGPRQVGKTTIAISLREKLIISQNRLVEYHSADDSMAYGSGWIDQIWESLRIRMRLEKIESAILILDEIQKITDWSAAIKKHWDSDNRENHDIKLVLLGSSRMLLMNGLSESLMGRYELSHAGHWDYSEMSQAFGFTATQYQWFGGYPGAATLVADEGRYKEYIRNAIIEPTMIRDVLMTARIDKPALLRQLLDVGINYSSQIVSFNKLLGQLQDAGNTTTLAKYLQLLEQSGLLSGLMKYSNRIIESRGTIPKFQVHNMALFSALTQTTLRDAFSSPTQWGRVVENSVGAYLVNQTNKTPYLSLYYWRENGYEIDYVIKHGERIVGIEVKSGNSGISEKVSNRFKERFPNSKIILIGQQGIPYEIFMKTELTELLD